MVKLLAKTHMVKHSSARLSDSSVLPTLRAISAANFKSFKSLVRDNISMQACTSFAAKKLERITYFVILIYLIKAMEVEATYLECSLAEIFKLKKLDY